MERDLSNNEFTQDLDIGHSSIRNILVHLLNSESYWIEEVLEKGKAIVYNPEEVSSVEDVRPLFNERREKTRAYLSTLGEYDLQNVETVIWNGVTNNFTVARALLHVATHEAHHHGLLVGLIRKLGGEPPDVSML